LPESEAPVAPASPAPSDLSNATTVKEDLGSSVAKGASDAWKNTSTNVGNFAKATGDVFAKGADETGKFFSQATENASKGFSELSINTRKSLGFAPPEPEPEPEPAPLVQQPLGELIAKLLGGFCMPCKAAAAA